MVYAPDAPILQVVRSFAEILSFDSSRPGDITIRLDKNVSPEKKQEITDAVKKCGFDTVNFIFQMVAIKFYGNTELTDDEKRIIMQALRDLANVMHNCGIHISETKLAFFSPETRVKKQPNS